MTTSKRFPTPEEVRESLEQSIEPVVDVLREHVHWLFSRPADNQGSRTFVVASIIANKIQPLPSYAVRKAAFEILKGELILSGWSAELVSDRDGTFVSIRPIGREDH